MTTAYRHHTLRNPQAVAWLVLLTAFSIFCGLAVLGTLGLRWFLFDSQIDMSMNLMVSRGRVDMTMIDGSSASSTGSATVTPNVELVVDEVSQGYLIFEDNYSRQTIARVFLLKGSTITLEQGWRPRFEWSRHNYSIRLGRAAGRFQIEIPDSTVRGVQIEISSAVGRVVFSTGGTYSVSANGEQLRVLAEAGRATLLVNPGEGNVEEAVVEAAQIGRIQRTEGISTVSVSASPMEVLNANFGGRDVETNVGLPIGWGCTNRPPAKQNEPEGDWKRSLYEDQVVVEMYRRGANLNHAETSCDYLFRHHPQATLRQNPPSSELSLDVTGYDSLAIRLKLKIRGQDLSTCGIAGSECPVMIELMYEATPDARPPDADVSPIYWRHGFYSWRYPTDDSPLSCDTCLQEHEKLNDEAWYLYDTGDLFRLLPPERRPARLLHLRIYASGHAYDSVVADVQVIAGRKIVN